MQQQLLAFDRPRLNAALQPSSSTTKQQQHLQKPPGAAANIQPAPATSLPGLGQLLGPVIASTTAAAAAAGGVNAAAGGPPQAAAGRAPVTQQQLLILWQDLLQALFPGAQSVGRQQSAVPQPGQQTGLPAWQQQQQGGYVTLPLLDVNLTVDDATQADEDASVSEDSWDDEEQAWEEVQQQEDEDVQQRQQQRDSRQQQAPGRLLAAAVDPLYVVSAQNCRRAAVRALRAYLQVGRAVVGSIKAHLQQMLTHPVYQGSQSGCWRLVCFCVLCPHGPSDKSCCVACAPLLLFWACRCSLNAARQPCTQQQYSTPFSSTPGRQPAPQPSSCRSSWQPAAYRCGRPAGSSALS